MKTHIIKDLMSCAIPPPITRTIPLQPEPVLLRVPLPHPGLPHTSQLYADVSVSISQLEELYLQHMQRKGIYRDSLWMDRNVRDVQWGDRNSLIFEFMDHTTR